MYDAHENVFFFVEFKSIFPSSVAVGFQQARHFVFSGAHRSPDFYSCMNSVAPIKVLN